MSRELRLRAVVAALALAGAAASADDRPLLLTAATVLDDRLELTFNRAFGAEEAPDAASIELHGGDSRRRLIEAHVVGRTVRARLDAPVYAGELVRAVHRPRTGNGSVIPVYNRSQLAAVALAALPDGGVAVAGGFDGAVRIGAHALRAAGDSDIFVARADRAGRWLWAVRAGGHGFDEAAGIAFGRSRQRLYVTGTTTIDSAKGSAIFIAELDLGGRWGWSQAVGAPEGGDNYGRRVAVDADGDIYVAGHFTGRVRAGRHEVTSAGRADLFLARLAPDGRWRWLLGAGGDGFDTVYALGLDARQRPVLAGELFMQGRFDGGGASFALAGSGWLPYLARASRDGRWQWAAAVPDTVGAVQALAADRDGLFAAGTGVTAGGGPAETPRAFLAHWDDDGALRWLRRLPWDGHSMGLGLALDAGSVYLVGQYTPADADESEAGAGPQPFIAMAGRGGGRWERVQPGGGQLLLPTGLAWAARVPRLIVVGTREDQAFTSRGAPTVWTVEPRLSRWTPLARLP